jgi:hypothetical protein
MLLQGGIEIVLDALVDGTKVLGEQTVFFASDGEKVVNEIGETGDISAGGGGGERDSRLSDFS